MQLTNDEEKALAGDYGKALSIAYKILLSIGEATNATKLVSIKWAHLSGVNYNTIGDAGLDFLKSFSDEARFSIFTTINPMGFDRKKPGRVSQDFMNRQNEISYAYNKMGARDSFSCIPYEIFAMPEKNTMVSFAESNAAVISNSIFGLLTNKESALSALASAVTGKAPYSDLRIEENRKPEIRVVINDTLESELDYGMLGYFSGKVVKGSCVSLNCMKKLDLIKAKSLSAAIGTSGACGMFAEDEEKNIEKISFGKKEKKEVFDELCTAEDGDIIALGSPQLGMNELTKIANNIKDKKFLKPCMIFCARSVYSRACDTGISKIIENSGAEVICDACICLTPLITKNEYDKVITNSIKASYYLNKSNNLAVCLKDLLSIIKEYLL